MQSFRLWKEHNEHVQEKYNFYQAQYNFRDLLDWLYSVFLIQKQPVNCNFFQLSRLFS